MQAKVNRRHFYEEQASVCTKKKNIEIWDEYYCLHPKLGAIQDRIEKNTMEANETMSDAFQDLDRLMAKATEMVNTEMDG